MKDKSVVSLLDSWEYEKYPSKRLDMICIDEHMQIPFCYLFKITGGINTELCFLTELGGINEKHFAYVEDEMLYAGFSYNIIKYDLKNNKLLKNVTTDWWIHNFFKLDDGFLLHEELTVKFFDKQLNMLWKDMSCFDMFGNLILKDNFEIGENYIAIIDWHGYKHYYNRSGRFKEEVTKFNSDNYKSSMDNSFE